MKEEIQIFIEKLKEERSLLNKRMMFLSEHKFFKEKEFLNDRFKVINEILYELEVVYEGTDKAVNVKFRFD